MGNVGTIYIPDIFGRGSSRFDILSGNGDKGGLESIEKDVLQKIKDLGIPYKVVDKPINTGNPDDYYISSGKTNFFDEFSDLNNIGGGEIKVPKTFDFESFDRNPFFPVIIKSEFFDGGKHKYMIETLKQWKKLRRFLLEGPIVGNFTRKEQEHLKKDIGLYGLDKGTDEYKIKKIEYNKKAIKQLNPIYNQPLGKDFFLFQEVIETPSNHYTSYRIITSPHGNILAASLLYSQHTKDNQKMFSENTGNLNGFWGISKTDYIINPNSRSFLNAIDIRSNYSQGGGLIPLNKTERSKNISEYEKGILVEHGITDKANSIPKKLVEYAKIIGNSIGRNKSFFTGIDFIQDKKGDFYLIEVNAGPGVQTYIDSHLEGNGTTEEAYKEIYQKILDEIVKNS